MCFLNVVLKEINFPQQLRLQKHLINEDIIPKWILLVKINISELCTQPGSSLERTTQISIRTTTCDDTVVQYKGISRRVLLDLFGFGHNLAYRSSYDGLRMQSWNHIGQSSGLPPASRGQAICSVSRAELGHWLKLTSPSLSEALNFPRRASLCFLKQGKLNYDIPAAGKCEIELKCTPRLDVRLAGLRHPPTPPPPRQNGAGSGFFVCERWIPNKQQE